MTHSRPQVIESIYDKIAAPGDKKGCKEKQKKWKKIVKIKTASYSAGSWLKSIYQIKEQSTVQFHNDTSLL